VDQNHLIIDRLVDHLGCGDPESLYELHSALLDWMLSSVSVGGDSSTAFM
jgi:hypothetical protein